MGNENQVTDVTLKSSKSHFLSTELPEASIRPQLYSLQDEFVASVKNRSFIFYLVILGFLSTLIGGTIILTRYVENRYQKVDFKIAEFQSVDLKDLLDSANNDEKKLSLTLDKLEKLRNDQERENDRNLRAGYAERIEETKQEITALRKSVAKSRERVRKGVDSASALINNYERLHTIKMGQQKKYYENQMRKITLKFNPKFRSRKLLDIMRISKDLDETEPPELFEYTNNLDRETKFSEERFSDIRENIANFSLFMERMRRIPYGGSTPQALRLMHRFHNEAVRNYEVLWSGLSGAIQRKNGVINSYQYALRHLARVQPESGYIVDPRNRRRVRVYMKRLLRIKPGAVGQVFGRDDEFIGKIEFLPDSGGRLARIIMVQPSKDIQPFDRILITYEREQP